MKIADAVNKFYPGTSIAEDGGSVNVRLPQNFRDQSTNFIAAIGGIEVKPMFLHSDY